MEEREEEDPSDGLFGLSHGAPGSGDGRVTHVDVSLHGQGQGQPDGRRVENLRHVFQHDHVGVARLFVPDGGVVAQRVNVEIPGKVQRKLSYCLC